jgi:signal transduction histidine kinase
VALFQHSGHDVVEADDGQDAIAKISIAAPDLVITDIVMPTMDGFELVRQLRSRPETQSTPVIVYTAGYDDKATHLLVENYTGATILPKPSDPEVVLKTVNGILGNEAPRQTAALGEDFRSAHLQLVTTSLHRRMMDLERANSELRELNKSLEKSNDTLRQFAYAAGHDLQEPLRNQVNSAQMLAFLCGDLINDEAAVFLKECVDGAARMHSMVKDLLAYTTVVEDSTVTHSLTDSRQALGEVLTNLKMVMAESEATVVVDELPVVPAEKTHLVQLFQNLVANALKYRRAGVPPLLHISAARSEDVCTFRVADNGLGFDPDYAERIFKIFKRLHNRDEYSGTGVGLAICSRIVAHYRGRIWAEGYPGQGATFFFTLPAGKSER